MAGDPFSLHTSPLDNEGCPTDPTSPVPPPWDLSARRGSPQAPAPAPSTTGSRVSEIGAMLAKWARNPVLQPYEEVFRAEPNEAWFDPARDPDHPTQFEIASVRPEKGQSILLFDYDVVPFGFSGVSALDYTDLPDHMLSGVFGYSLRINGQEPGQLRYRLQPINSTIRQQALRFNQSKMAGPAQLSTDDYAISQANDFAAAAGYGTGLHLQTSLPYGSRRTPFTEYIHDDSVLQITGVIFRPVDIPLAFVQARVAGFKGPSALMKNIQNALRASLG